MRTPCTFDGAPIWEVPAVKVELKLYGIEKAPRRYADDLHRHMRAVGYMARATEANL